VRVVAGELGGRKLRASPKIRPTTERTREAVFSILGWVEGLRVLDLFCGSGAYGIEAVSRGAARAVLVDRDTRAAAENAGSLDLGIQLDVVRSDALRFLRSEQGEYDLVFMDPPYRLAAPMAAELDSLLPAQLAPGARVIAETSPNKPMELSLPMQMERRYGASLIRIHGAEAGA
jgi:16S rRNA (guanine(966)-N(2))-methyltransferase RsmD